MTETREWTFENSTLRFEPPDVFWARFQGTLTLKDARASMAVYEELSEVRPFFFVAEMGGSVRLDPEAARYLSENVPGSWMRAQIYISTRLLHRALVKGLTLAAHLTWSAEEHPFEKIHHVSTEADARALIARIRAQGA